MSRTRDSTGRAPPILIKHSLRTSSSRGADLSPSPKLSSIPHSGLPTQGNRRTSRCRRGGRKPGGRKLESGIWNLESGIWNLEAGIWKPEAGSRKPEAGRGLVAKQEEPSRQTRLFLLE